MKSLFTSECVTCGHPDKVCDVISDSILDAYLDDDPFSRVAVETLVCQDKVVVAGEVTTKSKLEIDTSKVIKDAIKKIGYKYDDMKFNVDNVKIENYIHNQSPDIAMGVDINGAGDQGIMFGGAVKGIDKKTLMPDCWKLSKELSDYLTQLHKYFPSIIRCDGKTQVTLDYSNKHIQDVYKNVGISAGGKVKWDTIVVSVQHDPNIEMYKIKELISEHVIMPVIDKYRDEIDFDPQTCNIYINPTGRFVVGGPDGDSGVTGRKIVVDGYGGFFPVGGGAFSGKDPTKVDRSAAYMARYIAKNVVASGFGYKAEVQLSYAIGVPQPTSIAIFVDDTFDIGLSEWFMKNVAMDPKSIIERFDLRREKKLFSYADLAANGHFGREDIELPWEKIDLVEALTSKMGSN